MVLLASAPGIYTRVRVTLARRNVCRSRTIVPPSASLTVEAAVCRYYKYLNETGKQLLNLADIGDCTKEYTPEYIDSILTMLTPTVEALETSGM